MKYKIRRLLNKLTRGIWLKIRKLFSTKIRDNIDNNNIEYYLGSDIGNQLYLNGSFEKNELEICSQFINETSTVIDIGANIGIHSIHFSKLAQNGKILAVEPQITIYSSLLHNIEKCSNVIPINIAINSQMQISKFFIADDNAYSSLKDTKRKEIVAKKYVMTLPFDIFYSVFDKIDFIKIDVEGFEHDVILSMEKILIKHKPTLFVEIYAGTNSNYDPDKTILLLLDMGYSAYYVDNEAKLIKYTKHEDKFYNYFFIYEVH